MEVQFDLDRRVLLAGSSGVEGFIVHPNPANDHVTVSLNKDIAKESGITEQGFTVYLFMITYQGKFYSYEVIVQH